MTQVFADDDHVAEPGMLTRGVHIPMQPTGRRPALSPPVPASPSLGPAIMPGKGVRRIRCVGCSHDTLPRNDDGAPLCQRCSELLAAADLGAGTFGSFAGPVIFRTPRWLRRRSALG